MSRGFPSFCGRRYLVSRLVLPQKIHSFRRRRSGAQGSRLAQGDAWQKCDFAALYYTLIRVQRHAAAPRAPLIRKMRTAHFRGDAWQKCDFAALYYTLLRVQRHAAARPKARFWTAGYYTLLCKHCEEVSRKNEQVTSRHDQGWSAPRSRHAAAPRSVQFLASAFCPLKWTLQKESNGIVCFLALSTFVDSCFCG